MEIMVPPCSRKAPDCLFVYLLCLIPLSHDGGVFK